MGGSLGKSKSNSSNNFATNVFGPQGNALAQLYNMGISQANQPNFMEQITGQAGTAATGANQIADTAGGAYGDLASGGSFGDTSDIRQRLLESMGGPSQMGQMYESIVGGEGNEYIDPLIDRMRGDAATNLDRFRGQSALDAASMGQSGSSRQAMENAIMGSEMNRDLLNKEAELRAGGYDKDLAMKMDIAKMADTNRQSEQDRLFNMLQGANEAKSSAVGQGGLMQALQMGGMAPWLQAQQAGFNPINNLANIIGPAILTGSGKGSSSGKGFGTSGGFWGS